MHSTPAIRPAAPQLVTTLKLTLLAALLGSLMGLAPLGLPQARAADITHMRVNTIGANQDIAMALNKSVIVDLPTDVQEVIVSQPGVANAILRNKRRAVIQSTGSGDTNIFFLDGAGRTIVVIDVAVKGPSSTVAAALRETYSKVLPNSNIEVESVQLVNADGAVVNRVVLSGSAATADDVNKAVQIAGQFAGAPENVASVITVGGPQQVSLKVTIAEVQRDLVKQFGIDLSGSFSGGSITTGLISAPDSGVGPVSGVTNPNSASFGVSGGGISLKATLRALEQHGGLRTLAEPTLTAMSGQEAKFLVGGELPYSTTDDTGKAVTSFKEYGIQLTFTPTIMSNGEVGLAIDTSVSEPAAGGGLTKRQAKTNVEVGAGQTLSIGGLMQDSVRTQINRMPGLGDIPILGTLFRSRDFIHSQTELIVLVTPSYATPGARPTIPTDKIDLANDAESIFLGHIENVYGVGPNGTRGAYDGTVGFLLD